MSDTTATGAATAAPPASTKSILPAIAMTAGAGLAAGGLLDQQVADMITDVTKGLGWAWLQHPSSWAGVLISLGGLTSHILSKRA